MKKLIFISFIVCLAIASTVSARDWKQSFFNDVISFNYEIAVENALKSNVPVKKIVDVSTDLGYDPIFISAKVYTTSDKLIKTGQMKKKVSQVIDDLNKSGIQSDIIDQSTGMNESQIDAAVNSGEIYVPGKTELAMNFERSQGKSVESGSTPGNDSSGSGSSNALANNDQRFQNNQQEQQGLGFGDEPELGTAPDLAANQVNFSSGGNASIPVSPSAP